MFLILFSQISVGYSITYPRGIADVGFVPPLIQIKHGITPEHVVCGYGLELVIKRSDGSPACVKLATQLKLEQYGWALPTTQPNKDIMYCQKNPSYACNCTMELWYNDCKRFLVRDVPSCHDGRIEAYLYANGLANVILIHP